jgi:hypothetical protein
MWLKYSDGPILNGEQWDRNQSDSQSSHTKPRGFWITDDSDSCWKSWCVGEQWGLGGLTHKHRIDLDESNVLILRGEYQVRAFSREYGFARHWGGPDDRKWRDWCIDWRKVAARHDGIIIAPYVWSLRLEDGFMWYYGWDCASGCIWNARAILGIHLIEIDHEIAKPRDEAHAA